MNEIFPDHIHLALLLFSSCQPQFKNSATNEISIGDSLILYYTTNSCCKYCIVNANSLNNVETIEENRRISEDQDCLGCNYVGTFIFKGKRMGKDTVKMQEIKANSRCDSVNASMREYQIIVK